MLKYTEAVFSTSLLLSFESVQNYGPPTVWLSLQTEYSRPNQSAQNSSVVLRYWEKIFVGSAPGLGN